MNKIASPRTRRHKHKDDLKQDFVVQVHKTIAISDTSSERTNLSFSDDNIESNKTYKLEDKNDKNDNYSTHTPSREISVDGETQINSKILSLIETEMKRDINKHSHFTDSRPQSLSFYEDEKIPEELSGNLEMLSPEERKHYKKRKEYNQMDTEERNAYNVIQDLYNRDNEEVIGGSSKKSKSRKKRHGDPEMGIGNSREMMIPKEKKKSKKKKRESTSPLNSSSSKRKHRKKDNDYELKNDITVALEDLQDDVFENVNEEHPKVDKMNRSPRQSDKIYVQKKNKFEPTPRPNAHLNRQTAYDFEEDMRKDFFEMYPLQLAIPVQKGWAKISTLCHGLLGGLAIGQWAYVISNARSQDSHFLYNYSHYSQIYILLFYILCVICIVSVLDRFDLAHLGAEGLIELFTCKRCAIVMLLYIACLAVHLSTANLDEQINLMNIGTYNATICNMTSSDLSKWNYLTGTRSLLALCSWIIIGFFAEENNFYTHLKNMEKFLPTDR